MTLHNVADFAMGVAICALLLAWAWRWPRSEDPQTVVGRFEDEWVMWEGGKIPVDPGRGVVVHLRNGSSDADHAGFFCWEHNGHGSDIVAYQLV